MVLFSYFFQKKLPPIMLFYFQDLAAVFLDLEKQV